MVDGMSRSATYDDLGGGRAVMRVSMLSITQADIEAAGPGELGGGMRGTRVEIWMEVWVEVGWGQGGSMGVRMDGGWVEVGMDLGWW